MQIEDDDIKEIIKRVKCFADLLKKQKMVMTEETNFYFFKSESKSENVMNLNDKKNCLNSSILSFKRILPSTCSLMFLKKTI